MNNPIQNEIVETVIAETLVRLPLDVLDFYRNLLGRKPTETSKKIAEGVADLKDEIVLDFARDIVDRTIFSIFYLLDNNFKDKQIQVQFRESGNITSFEQVGLVEIYREKVDLHGIVLSERNL
jgi:hypothetical protein